MPKPLHPLPCLIFLLLIPALAAAQKVSIGLFFDVPVRAVNVAVQGGSYAVIVNDTVLIADMGKGDEMQLRLQQGKLRLKVSGEELGYYSSVKAVAMGDEGTFSLTCVAPRQAPRSYAQHVFFTKASDGAGLLLVNQLDEPLYLHGVLEAETGISAKPEFYKAQSILSRTYLYAHFDRHAKNGFNLCDGVHCQAYGGLLSRSRNIRHAVNETAGMIVIDTARVPITPAFHANCGGQTSSSGYVWREQLSYLQTTSDKYCRQSAGARWQKQLALQDWRDYMGSNGLRAKSSKEFEFAQPERKKFYELNGRQLELTKVRQRFGLRSTFFDVHVSGGSVQLQGRGFGHGVGLCQEGAMQMAEHGMSCEKIVEHYYHGASIISFNQAHSPDEQQRDSLLYLFNPWRGERGESVRFVE